MNEITYDIILQAPIGKRSGEVTFWIEDGRIKGSLRILGRETELEGTVDPEGSAEISGELITATRRFPYRAVTRLWEDTLRMRIFAGTRSYDLLGRKKAEKGRMSL